MSSLRNAAPRRNHKERGQLANRRKLGLLEKHQDYVLRARDYHAKQDKLTRLRVKATERNRDEFYFGMVKGRTEGGVHVQERGNQALPPEVVKLLKSQDANYIRTQKKANIRRIDALKVQLTLLADLLPNTNGLTPEELRTLQKAELIEAPPSVKGKGKKVAALKPKSGHVVFADDDDEANAYQPPTASTSAVVTQDDDQDDLLEPKLMSEEVDMDSLGWLPPTTSKGKRRKLSTATSPPEPDTAEVPADMPATEEERKEHRSTLLAELAARQLRDQQLRYALAEMELQKVLMGKGGKKKLKEAEEVKLDDGKPARDEDDEMDGEAKKEEKMWRPRLFKWKMVRRK